LNIFDWRVVLDCDWLAHQLVVHGTACYWLAVLCGSGWLELGFGNVLEIAQYCRVYLLYF